MKTIELTGYKRVTIGKKASKKLRAEGNVPCVLYGANQEPVHFYIPERSLVNIIYTPHVYLVNLSVDGNTYKVILKDVQNNPVTDRVSHIDFLQIYEDKLVNIEVPVNIYGESVGIEKGGKLFLNRRKIPVRAYAKDLPDTLDIDITNLDLGKSLKAMDLTFESLELMLPPEDVICSVKLTRTARAAAASQ